MLLGYTDRLSAAQGERIRFMVSCDQPTFTVEVVRLTGYDKRSAPLDDPTVGGLHPGRLQPLRTGSYGHVAADRLSTEAPLVDLTIQFWCMPTMPVRGRPQALLSRYSPSEGGFGVWIEPDGHLSFRIGSRTMARPDLRSPAGLVAWQWYFVAATYEAATGRARLVQRPLAAWGMQSGHALVERVLPTGAPGGVDTPLIFAATSNGQSAPSWQPTDFFNGKLDSPRLFNRALSLPELAQLEAGGAPSDVAGDAFLGGWDFSLNIASVRLVDVSGNEAHGQVVNMPARGMTGHAWSAEVLDISQAPEQWSAIHFHEDDLEDAGWSPSFEWSVPGTIRSGVYAAVLTARGESDCVPFFVRPPRGGQTTKIALLMPTMTYVAYANYRQSAEAGEQMSGGADIYGLVTDRPIELGPTDAFLKSHPELGLSHYETHRDGTATYYSSRLRPIVTMRPRYHYWMTHAPRHFAADLLLVEWLEGKNVEYDVITDEDLHAEGGDLLQKYRVVLTGSHPEYWTDPMLRGLESYLGAGGRLMYLGGNGLCWVTSVHPECPHVFEVRKGVFFVPMGNGVAGESCHSTTGERGGAWRELPRTTRSAISAWSSVARRATRSIGSTCRSVHPRTRCCSPVRLDDIPDLPPRPRRSRRLARAGRHDLLRNRARRGGLLRRIDQLDRQPDVQRSRQQRVESDRKRATSVHRLSVSSRPSNLESQYRRRHPSQRLAERWRSNSAERARSNTDLSRRAASGLGGMASVSSHSVAPIRAVRATPLVGDEPGNVHSRCHARPRVDLVSAVDLFLGQPRVHAWQHGHRIDPLDALETRVVVAQTRFKNA